jgi:DNA-binding transcriptional ArsR family regulator
MEMNKIIGSLIRRRILEVLSENKELAIMKLIKKVNSSHNEVDRNLKILTDENLITQQLIGRKRIIRLNYENKKTVILLKTLHVLKNADHY